jgi:hypothetical protein
MTELTSQQLRQAANIKDKIQALEAELSRLLGTNGAGTRTAKEGKMSAAAKAKISKKLKAAWKRRKKEAKAKKADAAK